MKKEMTTDEYSEISYFKCSCGAVTVEADGFSYSVKRSRIKQFFPEMDLRRIKRYPEVFCCNHCVNHYGLDLCGCGSGEPFGKCDNELPECCMPMQKINEYSFVRAGDSLL